MDANNILKRADRVSYEVVDGQAILLDLEKGIYFSLNNVGADFWDKLDGRQTIAQHAEAIARHYNTDHTRQWRCRDT